jgi:hypothetical protein
MDDRALLAQPHLTVVSGEPDFDLQHIAQTIHGSSRADGRCALETLLCRLMHTVEAGAPVAAKTLDLIGHTRSRGSLLALGDWVIDTTSPVTAAFFRGLADHDVLPRLGIRALRLLGCNTAATPQGRATIRRLADLLGIDVLGARQLLHVGHWGPAGFRDEWQFLLAEAGEHDRADAAAAPAVAAGPNGSPYPRFFDIDALPSAPLTRHSPRYSRRIATPPAARAILQLVRRREGAQMPGLLAQPSCELALPAVAADSYYIADVLLDGQFLRFYPDGPAASGILFPVDDAEALGAIIAALPRE